MSAPVLKADSRGTITTSGVEIAFSEQFSDIKNLEPGVRYYQNASIKNTKQTPVYLRVSVEIQTSNETDSLSLKELQAHWGTGWILGEDGMYYYSQPIAPGADIRLFDTFSNYKGRPYTLTIPTQWTQETAPDSILLTVTPQAVQAENFPAQFQSWPYWTGL
ncbi:hypothetical protein U6B65_00905 [Oscillospiraceae bacterium MB08-C2-2]|nr:hypothetical protein U6B65_00905 [Oscillospiraceae bacterium MB08-C2-2]